MHRYWFEVFECVRKILLVGLPCFFSPGSMAEAPSCQRPSTKVDASRGERGPVWVLENMGNIFFWRPRVQSIFSAIYFQFHLLSPTDG